MQDKKIYMNEKMQRNLIKSTIEIKKKRFKSLSEGLFSSVGPPNSTGQMELYTG